MNVKAMAFVGYKVGKVCVALSAFYAGPLCGHISGFGCGVCGQNVSDLIMLTIFWSVLGKCFKLAKRFG